MPRRAKVLAVTMILVTAGASGLLAIDDAVVGTVVIAVGLGGGSYVAFGVPTRERVLGTRVV